MHWSKWSVLCRPKAKGGLGFRDIRKFNSALLAKQLWRLVTHPDSLVARVFKARYCPDGGFLSARVKSNASFVWRSILSSRELVAKGLGWRIGDGESVAVYSDSWVKGVDGNLLGQGEAVRVEGLRVRDLLTESRRWDSEKLQELFSPMIREAILRTPIGEMGCSDERIWRYDEKGRFSVKSAYLLATGFYEQHTHTSAPDRNFWSRMVWGVLVPPKTRVFMWRALNNFIPTAANLRGHHVPIAGICRLCDDRWESTEHSLLFCPLVRGIWKSSRFAWLMKKASGLDLLGVATVVRREFGEEGYELWVVMVWQVWLFICRLLHPMETDATTPSEASCAVLREVFQAARPASEMADSLGIHLGERVWRRPQRGLLRVDVDARFDPDSRAFGVGVVVRDHNGQLVAAMMKPTSPSSSALMAEVMAVVHGVVFCVEMDLGPVEIFTDSFLAARVMADPDEERQLLPDDICDILRIARANFLLHVSHMFREANGVAHSLANRAASGLQSTCWTADFPLWLRDIVAKDTS